MSVTSGRLPRSVSSHLRSIPSNEILLRSDSTLSILSNLNSSSPDLQSRPGTPILTPRTKFHYSPDIAYQSTENVPSRAGSATSQVSHVLGSNRPVSCLSAYNEEETFLLPTVSENELYDYEDGSAAQHLEREVPPLVTLEEEEEEEDNNEREIQLEQHNKSLNSNKNETGDNEPPLVEGEHLILRSKLPQKSLISGQQIIKDDQEIRTSDALKSDVQEASPSVSTNSK